ncbi:hypothetical protein L1285_10240 [Pseudoalteromonas sp. DL2-H2.2]|uniref:hypothetical protein n=1 Tax=Pseudoalteromonas sp. DL2-H2.2 TaxID=2908889 RepID=UPI001F40E55B|nr:hypothetical protein [Pseudoalteromonas sp. DL2-H2.2]MCF2908696.1 hypothetical protein [Pseudoalteromonas sp. DL2-H2.2]
MKIKLHKKSIKQLTHVQSLSQQQTPHIAGGESGATVCNSIGCDTAAYFGCPTGDDCYSAPNKICIKPF